MKKFISIILSVTFAFAACFPVAASEHSQYDTQYGDFWISYPNDYSVKITDYTGDDTDVVIPDEIDGYPVTVIGKRAFWKNENIRSLKLPSAIEKLESEAFNKCTNLTEIIIPKSLIKSDSPFNGSGIITATIEDGTTKIPANLFWGCKKLENVSIPNTVTEIDDGAFTDCVSLRQIKLPDNLDTLFGAFSSCDNLESVTIPKSLKKVVDSPFAWSGVKKVVFEDGMTTIPDEIFYCADELIEVSIPETVTMLGSHSFAHCYALEQITLPKNLKEIGYACFSNCSSLKSIVLPNTLESIDGLAFDWCKSLRELTVPASVTSMGDGIFINIGEDFVMSCYVGSVAYNYALKNNIKINRIKEYVLGDINLDGTVNVSDATLLQKYIADIETLADEQTAVSDVNGDGTINVYDVTGIQKIAVA